MGHERGRLVDLDWGVGERWELACSRRVCIVRRMQNRSSIPEDGASQPTPDEEDLSEKSAEEPTGLSSKNPAAVALGRLGGLKGGPARALKLSAEERTQVARRAAQPRWAAKGKAK